MASREQARQVKDFLYEQFVDDPNCAGIGLVTNKRKSRRKADYGVKINFHQVPSCAIPEVIDSVPIRMEIVGQITKK